ncbi:unnamed protein product [Menidia menidia]|uniref:(Atlantic silverside) hypothetical protein n=1 Tax=Menidia menidia TaxID=238744 RepID=A0A8S4BUH5_9TELE|nr:unnamed protein product [Menidia menidia]
MDSVVQCLGHTHSHFQEVKCGTATEGQQNEPTAENFRSFLRFREVSPAAKNENCGLMAVSRILFSLAVCVLLGQQTSAKNDAPCQPSRWNNGFKTFIKRHIASGAPSSLDQNEWEKYIRGLGNCNRPTQSFLSPEDLEKVRAVCTNGGGKVLKDNLCISQKPFTFVTVRSEQGTCGIKTVKEETKHLILACEVLDNQCLPVHFEGNPTYLKPSNNAKGCQDPEAKAHAPSSKTSWLWDSGGPTVTQSCKHQAGVNTG